MAALGPITVPVTAELTAAEAFVPSALRPYAKALVAAVPALLTAFGVLQSGHVGVVSVIQFLLSVLGVGAVYGVPLLKGRWESGAKTGVAAVIAVLSAAVAGFGNGGTQGWLGFGSAALAAVLVEIVDNVPNVSRNLLPIAHGVEQVAAAVAKVPLPTVDQVSVEG